MSLVLFQTLPDSSRLWIFAADRRLSTSESELLLSTLDEYLQGWKAHGAPVSASRELRYEQFLFIAANPEITAPSGCSIDSMTRAIKSLGEQFHVNFFGTINVFYRDGETVRMTDRGGFRKLVESGEANAETIVFDNTLTELGELREGKWETAAANSWHGRAFKLSEILQ